MYENQFTNWVNWNHRNIIEGIEFPGIYAVAITTEKIASCSFSWIPKIIYIGMTNSVTGLKGRLIQFDNTIKGKRGHGSADRILYKHQNYEDLLDKLYVSVSPFKCDVRSKAPNDLRIMGEVAKFEYDCFAHFVEKYGELPEFNNKKQSPKFSLTINRKNGS